jgi:P2 family phage contractile tail tube protein
MSIQVNRLTNANIYIDGNSFLGRAEEVTNPVIKAVMSEHKALGMVGKFELPSGLDKMEGRIKWNAMYPDVMRKVGNSTKTYPMQVRASLETHGPQGKVAEVPVVIFMTVQFKDLPLGNFKQHDNAELESVFNVTYCKMVIDGAEIVEVDVLANIYKVDGVDQLAQYRANLGI